MIKLGFLASNNGSSMRAIIAACEAGVLAATPVLAVSNRAQAPALAFGRQHGVATLVIPTAKAPASADRRLAEAFSGAGADLVVLSGYLRKLGPITLERFAGRVLNIHPALLPRFGGPGMYGRAVHTAVIAAGETVSGASVHLVDGDYDHGAVVAQRECVIFESDTPETLEARVMALEAGLFVETLQRIVSGVLRPPGLKSPPLDFA
ncbi:MAG TPA: phosphoribosylglycinamide formyltransferase [Dongiaceae bacterium]